MVGTSRVVATRARGQIGSPIPGIDRRVKRICRESAGKRWKELEETGTKIYFHGPAFYA
jgi:hypothetical protein